MKKKQSILIALDILFGIGLAVYAYLGSFTRMMADDYCSAAQANRLGLFRSMWSWYIHWTGKFSAFAADWFILKATLGPYGIQYFFPIMVVLWFVFLASIFYLYFRNKNSSALSHSILSSAGFLFVLFLISPNVEQSLFWWNGARSYSFPAMVLTLSAALLYALKQFEKISPRILYALSFVLFFLVGGMGETYVIGQAGFLAFLIFSNIINNRAESKTDSFIFAAGLAGTLLSIVVIILAPGNAVRQALLPPSPSLFTLIWISLQAYAVFIYEIVTSPLKIAGLAGIILVLIWIGMQYKDRVHSNIRSIVLNILGALALSFICFPPGVYGYSEPPPSRTLTIPTFFFLAFILYASYLIGVWRADRIQTKEIFVVAAALILIACAVTFNSLNLLNQRQAHIDFAEKWDKVNQLILDAKADKQPSVNIPSMSNWAYLSAPNDNPKYWINHCYARYYGIQVYGPPMDEIMKDYYEQGPN